MQEGKRLRTTILALAWTALTAVFALGTPATAAAQGTATIRGTVTDASGGVLPGATVTITNSGTKDTRTAVTDDRGGYTFASLFNGTYEVKVELEGFKGYDAKNIVLSPNDTRGLDVMLEVGSLTDVITVSTPLEIVQTETGAREGVLARRADREPLGPRPQLARAAAHPARRRRPGQHRVRERQLRRRREQHAGLHGQRHPLLRQHGQPGRLGPHRHRVEQRRHRDAEQRHGAGGQGPELELRRRARRGRHERQRGHQVRQLAVPRLALRLHPRFEVRGQRPLEQHRRHRQAEEQVQLLRRQRRRSGPAPRLQQGPQQDVLLRGPRSAAPEGRPGRPVRRRPDAEAAHRRLLASS